MNIDIRAAEKTDLAAIAEMVEISFAAGVAADFGAEGQANFRAFAAAEEIGKRLDGAAQGFVALSGDRIAGFIEMNGDHLRMLFVHPDMQGKGVGQALFARALAERPDSEITVHASPRSLGAYRVMGFRATGASQEKNGFVFTPMVRAPGPRASRR